jgi:hypothetical protein
MLDLSFFWESETKQSSRARSLPVRTRLDSMTTLSQYTQPARSQQRPAAEAPVGYREPVVVNDLTDSSLADTLDAWRKQKGHAPIDDDHIPNKMLLPS